MEQTFNGKPGDLIEISRWGYRHYAIYIGGDEVVHLVNEGGGFSGFFKSLSRTTGLVKCEKLTDVVAISHVKVNNQLDEKYKPLDPSIIVKEACKMVGNALTYSVFTYNSSHFAADLRYGKTESRQFNGKPGDLIEIFRGPFQHWAVYIGENEVVHFTTKGGQSSGSSASPMTLFGKVKREKLADVVGSNRYQINNRLDNSREARDPSIIVEEACAMVGSKFLYSVFIYNCEHFASEMRYGKKKSGQVQEATMFASIPVYAVASVAGAPVVAMGVGVVGIVSGCKAIIRVNTGR